MKNSWQVPLVVVALAVGFGAGRMTVNRQTPANVSFDSQAKTYIDSKMAGMSGGAANCDQLPQLIERVADLEKKAAVTEKLKALREQSKSQRASLNETLNDRLTESRSKLEILRRAELKKLRLEIGHACASVK